MSRRHILEDSDDEDHDDGIRRDNPSASATTTKANDIIASIFTADEMEAIQRCNLKTYANNGIYSEECMSRVIERVMEESPIELMSEQDNLGSASQQQQHFPSYQKYRPKIGEEKIFFKRDIYTLHNPSASAQGGGDYTSYFEEAILFEIELLRRSEKAVKNRMFKNKETGGMVVFGPWWNYAFQRLLEPSLSNISVESLGEYTVVKIIRSLFHFITDDLKDIVKPGKLTAMKDAFGVDWSGNITTARKVVNQCGVRAQLLDKELSAVEAHVDTLRKKSRPISLLDVTTSSVTPTPVKEAGTPSKLDPSEAQNNARKARLAAMRKDAMRTAASPIKETAHLAQSRDRNSTSGGTGHTDVRTVTTNKPSNNDDGWGRNRDEDSQIFKSMCSFSVARQISNCDVPLPKSDVIMDHGRHPQQNTAPSRGGGREGDYGGNGGDRYSSISISDNNSPQYRDSKISGSYEDRSYRHGSSREVEREDYRYDDSRGRRDDYRGGNHNQSRSREEDTNYNSGYGRKRSWDPDRIEGDSRPQKAAKGMFDTSAQSVAVGHASAAIPSGTGRGRGAHVNKPAWMTKQDQSSANDRPLGFSGSSDPIFAPPQAESNAQNLAMNTAHAGGVTNEIHGMGRGRGRGASRNLPAWMTMTNPSNP